ncbi:hypothetical protein HF086_002918 [Spodoptera exigua]|uniref:Uncharacterized protein n=1 Tax=Spodoptera exigua TaxID=7107 RepID=A0A922SD76_SPOEX|nr:hypothetical protein HF086_002918 [Spodoptera exigua]
MAGSLTLGLGLKSQPCLPSANHHKKNKGNVKAEGNPSAGDGVHPVNAGEVHWPEVEVSRIHNFPVPEAFKHGPSNHSHTSEVLFLYFELNKKNIE